MCPWSISEAEAQLDPGLFVRVHRSHIVAIPHVTFVRKEGDGAVIELDGPIAAPGAGEPREDRRGEGKAGAAAGRAGALGSHRPLRVVPANAGTHNHRICGYAQAARGRVSILATVCMGPGVRRDDGEIGRAP